MAQKNDDTRVDMLNTSIRNDENASNCTMCKFVLIFAFVILLLTFVFVFVMRMDNPLDPSAPLLPEQAPAAVNAELKEKQLQKTAELATGTQITEAQ